MVFILSALWWRRIRGLWKLPGGRDWLRGKLDLVLISRAMLSKSLIQFSVDGGGEGGIGGLVGCVPSLLFDLRPNYGGGNEDNGNLFQKVTCTHCCIQCPWPCSRPPSTHASTGDSWTLTGKSGSVSCGVTASFSWVPVHTKFCLCPPRVSQSYVSSGGSMVGLTVTTSKRAYAIPRSAAPRAPAPAAGHCWPVPLQETLKHSSGSVSVGVSGCWCTRGLFEPSEHLWWVRGLILKVISCFKSVNFLIPSMISGKFHEVIGHV